MLGSVASWRITFLFVGAPGLLVALWVATVREPARRGLLRTLDGRAASPTVGAVIEQIRLRWQSVLGISVGMVFQSTCTYGLTAWTPAFFQRVHGWTAGEVGRALGLLLVCFGCLGMYLCGVLTDRWRRQGILEAPMRVGVIGAIGAGTLFVVALLAGSPVLTLTLFAPALVFLGLPMGISYAALQWILPNQVRGQVSALFLLILNLGGITLGPLVPAAIGDYIFHSEQMIGVALAISIALAALGQLAVFYFTCQPYRRHSLAMEALTS